MLGSLDRAMIHTLMLKDEFDAVLKLDADADDYLERLTYHAKESSHGKLAYLLQAALTMTLEAQRMIEQFGLNAYGPIPDKVERWTKTGEGWRKAQEDEKDQ